MSILLKLHYCSVIILIVKISLKYELFYSDSFAHSFGSGCTISGLFIMRLGVHGVPKIHDPGA